MLVVNVEGVVALTPHCVGVVGVMLSFAGNVLVCVLLAFAMLVVITNWGLVVLTPTDKAHHSMMGGVVQVVVLLAASVSYWLADAWAPAWMFWCVALIDISLYAFALAMSYWCFVALAAPFRRKH